MTPTKKQPQKRAPRRAQADPVESFGPVGTGPELVDDDVVLQHIEGLGAAFLPISLRNLQGTTLLAVVELQRLSRDLAGIRNEIDELVPQLREAGVAWAGIAWCLGLSADGARSRWSE